MTKFLPDKIRRPREEMQQAVIQVEILGYTVAGSWRREKDTVGDLDIIVPAERDFGEACEEMTTFFGYEMIRHGSMKSEGIAEYHYKPLLLNLWRVPTPEAWAAMLLFSTGPYSLNIMMRAKALSKGWKLSQYGLFERDVEQGIPELPGRQLDGGAQEVQIFELLGLEYLTPPERENWQDRLLATPKKTGAFVQVLSSNGQDYYQVEVVDGKAVECECKGFTYRKSCRHLAEAEKQLKNKRLKIGP